MTLTEQLAFVRNETWQVKVGLIAVRVALVVQAESAATTNHAVRAALSLKVLTEPNPKVWGPAFTTAVATLNNLPAVPTDQQLATAVTNVWSAMAGAPTAAA